MTRSKRKHTLRGVKAKRKPSPAASAAARAMVEARVRTQSPERRSEIARLASEARWRRVREAREAAATADSKVA